MCVYVCILVCMRVNIWVPEHQLEKIDAYCKESGISRSKLLIKATLGTIGDIHTSPQKKEKKEVKHTHIDKGVNTLCEHGRMKGLCEYGCD